MREPEYIKIKNRIHELRSLIASDWPGIEERKRMYEELAILEGKLKELDREPTET